MSLLFARPPRPHAGLYFTLLMKKADRAHSITVLERTGPDDTFGWAVFFSDLRTEDAGDPSLAPGWGPRHAWKPPRSDESGATAGFLVLAEKGLRCMSWPPALSPLDGHSGERPRPRKAGSARKYADPQRRQSQVGPRPLEGTRQTCRRPFRCPRH